MTITLETLRTLVTLWTLRNREPNTSQLLADFLLQAVALGEENRSGVSIFFLCHDCFVSLVSFMIHRKDNN